MIQYLPKEITFYVQIDNTKSTKATCYEHDNTFFKCKSINNEEVLIKYTPDYYSEFQVISINNKPTPEYFDKASIILKDIKELEEEYDVELSFKHNTPTITAYNEGGHNCTSLELNSLIDFLIKNFPDKIKEKLIQDTHE